MAGLEALRASRRTSSPVSIEALAGDVGRRRYFRIALPDNRTVARRRLSRRGGRLPARWGAARALLADRVRVPALLADDGRGNQIVEDLGSEDLAARCAASPDAAAGVARAGGRRGGGHRRARRIPASIAPFDAALFRRELDLAREAVFDLYLAPAALRRGARGARRLGGRARRARSSGTPRRSATATSTATTSSPSATAWRSSTFRICGAGPTRTTSRRCSGSGRRSTGWTTPRRRPPWRVSPHGGPSTRTRSARGCGGCSSSARGRSAARSPGRSSSGKGETYRRYLPGELALVRRLLGNSPEDRAFGQVLESRAGAGLLS